MEFYHETEEGKNKSEKRKSITEPAIGSIVSLTRVEKGKPYDVYITNGKYYSNGRMSNFWYWRRVNKDGTLGKEENGYGGFSESENKYEIQIIAKLIKES
jgi:hypothetical protein